MTINYNKLDKRSRAIIDSALLKNNIVIDDVKPRHKAMPAPAITETPANNNIINFVLFCFTANKKYL